MKNKSTSRISIVENLILIGIGCAVVYWILQSAMDVFIFHKGTLVEQILITCPKGLSMRLLVVGILIAFSAYAQSAIKKRKQVEEKLRKYREHLEELVKERTNQLEEKTAELQQANIHLQELDRLKSMFIASMSHELRTPLNSIIGFTGIILRGMTGEITEEQRKQLTMVKSSAHHLLALINDVIDVSKIEAGKIELAIEEFDLSALVQEVKDSFSVTATDKGIKMSIKTPETLTIKSDERRTKQVIVNLVGNAVKFTDKGEIEINVTKKEGLAEVSVRDTGIGIRKEDLDKLFKAFSQIPIGVG